MKRTTLLFAVTLFFATVKVGGTAAATESNDTFRPNIILLLTDDQRDNTLAGMGHPFVKTPNMDRLLRQSVRFRNAYIAEPVCAPSRVSLFTGMHERVHGLLMGEYGMGGKTLLYDLASKIPCLIFAPQLPANRRGKHVDHLVSSLDITKTILDYAGVAAPDFMAGDSLRPLVEGKDIPWRQELFLERLYTGRDTPFQEGVRFGKWKYIRMYDGVTGYNESDVDFTNRTPDFEMLFDLEADLREINNLVESQAGSQILAMLRNRCAAHAQKLNQQRQDFRKVVQVRPR